MCARYARSALKSPEDSEHFVQLRLHLSNPLELRLLFAFERVHPLCKSRNLGPQRGLLALTFDVLLASWMKTLARGEEHR